MENAGNEILFSRGTNQDEDSDIWDDTALIKAYDKAVESFKHALKKEDQDSKQQTGTKKRKNYTKNSSRKRSAAPLSREWKIGDTCCAPWTEDGNWYPAEITSVDHEAGTCIVVYTEYGNEEEHFLKDILPSDTNKVEACKKLIPPPPPMIPPPPPMISDLCEEDEALGSMLMSWYMSGYHTGYYLGLKQQRKAHGQEPNSAWNPLGGS